MIRNYVLIAFRNLWRHKAYSAINVTGLAVGMAVCLLIGLFVRDELSYDRFHEKADRIYRVTSDWGSFNLPATNPPFVSRFESSHPDITVARLYRFGSLVEFEDRRFREDEIFYVTPSFFDVFSFELIEGDPSTVLSRPNTALVTPETAKKYFGDEDPIGKTILLNNAFEFEITGIVKEAPRNSHFHYSILGSWASLDAANIFNYERGWGNNAIYTYMLLPTAVEASTVAAEFPGFIERHAGDSWNGSTLGLQALTDIHLRSNLSMELEPNGKEAYVYVFSAIGLFILLVACINFMNLSTARSTGRAREVGVRKVVGAHRQQLIRQFLAESMLLSLTALVLAVALAGLALPVFRTLSGKEIEWSVLSNASTVIGALIVALLTGILAGSYPAFFLSSFRPVTVLKGSFRGGSRGAFLRKGLVVFQFGVSTFLIIGTLVVYQQLEYLRSFNLGFQKEQVITVDLPPAARREYPALKESLLRRPEVVNVSVASETLPGELLNGLGYLMEGAPQDSGKGLRTVSVGHDFFETLGVEMIAGRTFSVDRPSDSTAIVLNEKAFEVVRGMVSEPLSIEEAIGKRISVQGTDAELIGIAPDFNLASLHADIPPIAFHIFPNWFGNLIVRVKPGPVAETMASLEAAWQRHYPEWPMEYSFVDQNIEAAYRAEERLGGIFTSFSVLAIFIACLGLFGLAAYTAGQRTKEIGVRKVLGASVSGILYLLSREFAFLVLIALLFAAPAAYAAMSRWLDVFPYHIKISAAVFVTVGVGMLVLAVLTVSYQSLKAATTDPVKSLRYE